MKARKYDSELNKILSEITELEMRQSVVKMMLPISIESFIILKDLDNKRFAIELGKSIDEINNWLSGTHNFTIDELIQISFVLKIELSELLKNIRTY